MLCHTKHEGRQTTQNRGLSLLLHAPPLALSPLSSPSSPQLFSLLLLMLTIHDNEGKFVVVLKERGEGLCVEAVVAEVEGGVDWSERLKVNVDLLFLALLRDHGATVHDEAIGRHCNPFQTSKRERNKGEGGGMERKKEGEGGPRATKQPTTTTTDETRQA